MSSKGVVSILPEQNAARLLLLGANLSTDNLGVEALTKGALRVLAETYPEATINLLDYGKRRTVQVLEIGDRKVRVELCNLRFSWRLWLPNNIALLIVLAAIARLSGSRMRTAIVRSNRWLQEVASANGAFAVSGGDSFSDIYGMGRLLYVALPQLLVLILGGHLVQLPQTIGPFRGRVAQLLASVLLSQSDLVFSRDRDGVGVGQLLMTDQERRSRVRFAPDLGTLLKPARPSEELAVFVEGLHARSSLLVGINISGLLATGGYNPHMFRFEVEHMVLMNGLVRYLVEKKGAHVLLIPHVLGTQSESDLPAMDRLYRELPANVRAGTTVIGATINANEAKYIIGLCDIFVGARMHACIAALSQGVPAIGVAYSRKFAGVFETFEAESLVFDTAGGSLDVAVKIVDRVIDNKEAIRAVAMQRATQACTQLLGMLSASRVPA